MKKYIVLNFENIIFSINISFICPSLRNVFKIPFVCWKVVFFKKVNFEKVNSGKVNFFLMFGSVMENK